jgi:drug/metabolite transporter (DMT)-like permease
VDQRHPAQAYAAALGMSVAFGLSFVFTKYALRGFEPLLIALIRFALAGAVLWLIWRVRRGAERASRAELRRLALLGFVSLTLYFTLEINGIARTTASAASIIVAAIPVFVIVLSAATLGERSGARQWLGVALSFAGVAALIELGGSRGGGSLGGDLLVLGAAFTAAVGTLIARRLMVSRSALYVTAYQNLFGALFMAPLALLEALLAGVRTPSSAAVGAVLYLTLGCSVLAYLLLNYAFRFLEASRVAVFINLTPVVAVAAAYVLLGERFGAWQALAALVVVVGVWLANSGARSRETALEVGA